MATTTTDSIQSRAEKFARQPAREQIQQWRQQWSVIGECVDNLLEQIQESTDQRPEVFDKNDLYPRVPLACLHFAISMSGFTPSGSIKEDVSEVLFSQLPTTASLAAERSLAGQPA